MLRKASSARWFLFPLLLALSPADPKGVPGREPGGADKGPGLTEVHVLRGHRGSAFGVAVTPDGRRALTAGVDGTLRVWDLATGKELYQIQAHDNWAVGLAVFPDGKRAVTSGNDRTARLWDLEARKEVRRFEGHGGFVWPVAVSADGKRVLSGSHDKTVRLWDVESGGELRCFDCPIAVWGIALSPDGKRLLAPGTNAVRLLNAATGAEERAFPVDRMGNLSPAFSPDGKRALAGAGGGRLFLWDLETGKQLHQLEGHGRGGEWARQLVRFVAFSPDGQWAATTGYDTTVRLWDLAAGAELARYDWHPETSEKVPVPPGAARVGPSSLLFGVAFTPDGRRIVAAGADGLVRVLQINVKPAPALTQVPPKPIPPSPPAPPPGGPAAGKVALAVTGSPLAGELLTLTATVEHPGKGQSLKLELPEGLELAKGRPVEEMPPPAGNDTATVSWQVKAARPGQYAVRVHWGGVATSQTVVVRARDIPDPGKGPKAPAGGPDKGGSFHLDYVRVQRGYTFFGPDPKTDKTLFNPKEEHLKPGKFEISVSRAYYAHKAVFTVDAPETVEDGQSVTVKATADATWDLTLEKPLTSSGLELGLWGAYGVKGDKKNLGATPQEPFRSGTYRLQAEMSHTATVGENLKQFFGGYGPWPPPEKDMEYRSFALNMTTNINGNIGRIDTWWYYKRRKAGTVEPKPDPVTSRVTVAVTGPLTAGERLTVSAKVDKPAAGQALRLELPAGVELVGGHPEQPVPSSGAVAWQVTAARPGRYEVTVRLGSGGATSQAVTIAPRPVTPEPKLVLSLPDTIAAGRPFTVTAQVTGPLPNQALTLALAPSLERLEGQERQVLPPPGGRESTVSWKVKGAQPGRFSVRVRLSTGAEQEKTITINPPRERHTLLDAQRALKMWVGMIPEEMELDVDGSGHVDSHDAVLILQTAGVRMEKQP